MCQQAPIFVWWALTFMCAGAGSIAFGLAIAFVMSEQGK